MGVLVHVDLMDLIGLGFIGLVGLIFLIIWLVDQWDRRRKPKEKSTR